MLVLLARVILSWIQVFNPQWRPSGPLLVIANAIYALTDPPVRAAGRLVPPLRLGNVGLDVGFLIVVIALIILERVFLMLAVRF